MQSREMDESAENDESNESRSSRIACRAPADRLTAGLEARDSERSWISYQTQGWNRTAVYDMATIEMEIEVHTEIGIAPTEIGRKQALIVGLSVEVADRYSDAAARSGSISDTLDYGRLRRVVHEVFAERRWDLLEQVATTIRDRIRQMTHVESARISVTKLCPWADVKRLTLTR